MEITVLLIITLIILAGFAIYGACVGFLRLILYLVGLVLSIMLMAKFTPVVASFLIENTSIETAVETHVREVFSLDTDGSESEDELIEKMELPEVAKSMLMNNNTDEVYTRLLVEKFADYIAGYLSKLLIYIISFIACVIAINLVYRFILVAFDVIDRIPIIAGLNRLSGFLGGIVEGFLVIELIYLAMVIFAGTQLGAAFHEEAGKNMITQYLYENNLLLMVVGSLVLF